MDNYEQLVERISTSAGVSKDEIERKVEAKRAKLSGLVSKEGAVQIVAAELGINFERERSKISELMSGMKRASVVGKIIEIFPIREYNKNGREGKVANLLLADDTGNVRTVLWDTNHISLIESGKLKKGDVVEISNANVRNGELHLSSFADIKQSKEIMKEVIKEKVYLERKFGDAKPGMSFKTRAFIVQVFEPRYFEVCPECGKRVLEGECKVHGKVEGKKKALINVVLDDGSETLRSVVFGDEIKNLGLNEEEIFSLEKFNEIKDSLLGEEKMFIGNMRNNALYNTLEFGIEKIEVLDLNNLVRELETKA